ncbi:MAG: substrate-binding domain-containing protein [Planctomycetota bacterium]
MRGTIDRLAELLFVDGICVDGKVPSERRLEELTGVSRRTVRKALLELDRLNVTRRVGPRTRSINESARDLVSGPDADDAKAGASKPPLLQQTILLVRHRVLPYNVDPEQFRGRPSHVGEAFLEHAYRHDRPILHMRPALLLRRPERELRELPVAGAVLTEDAADHADGPELVRRLREVGLSVVIQTDCSTIAGADVVRSDHDAGSYAVTRWLLDQGRDRFVRLWHDYERFGHATQKRWIDQRAVGHTRAMEERGLPPAARVIARHPPADYQNLHDWFRTGTKVVQRLLATQAKSGLDAVICSSDTMVGLATSALRSIGLEPGVDVLVTGYDNYWRTFPTRQFDEGAPSVTVDKRHARIAATALALLDARNNEAAKGNGEFEVTTRTVTPRLVVVTPSVRSASRS